MFNLFLFKTIIPKGLKIPRHLMSYRFKSGLRYIKNPVNKHLQGFLFRGDFSEFVCHFDKNGTLWIKKVHKKVHNFITGF
jgi:hypothetical protein